MENNCDHAKSIATKVLIVVINRRTRPLSSADLTVAVEVLTETHLDLAEEAGGHLIVATFCRDDDAKFGVKIEGLETIRASFEM